MGEDNKKKSAVKILVVDIILLVLVGLYVFDILLANSFKLDISTDWGEKLVADGTTMGNISVVITDAAGNPCVGHSVYALVESGGGHCTNPRNTTDENGMVVIQYVAQRRTASSFLSDTASIRIYDESNSVFFMVPKTEFLIIEFERVS